jgi:3-carboxy-cis,cis-muconate cycloisomerase
METVMMRLAPSLGRGAAHDLLHRLVHTARAEGTPLRTLLDAAPEVRDTLDAAALDAMLDPVRNAGQSAAIAGAAADAGRRRAAALRGGPAQASDMQAAASAQAARPA